MHPAALYCHRLHHAATRPLPHFRGSRRAMAAATPPDATTAAAANTPPPPPLCRIAVAQMTSTSDAEQNFRVCSSLAQQASQGGARMLFLPECFAFIGEKQQDALSFAQPLSGGLMRRYRALAKKHGLWMSLGGFQERCSSASLADQVDEEARLKEEEIGDEDEEEEAAATNDAPAQPPAEKVFNAHVVVDPRGRVAAVYRKIHLFDVDVPNGPVLLESRTTNPGDRLVVVGGCGGDDADANDDDNSSRHCPCGPLALTTCYDLRFPEMFAALAFGDGGGGSEGKKNEQQNQHHQTTRVIAVPSAFTKPTGAAHWELLLRARAVETQCYVVAAAQAGKHNSKRESYGDSMVVDPWGEVVARVAEGPLATGLAFADLSAERVEEVRRRMPIRDHRQKGRSRWFKVV